MEKLPIPPNQEGYAVEFGDEIVSVILDGGMSRSRQDILGATSIINVSWDLNPTDYTYMMAFYNSVAAKGALPFYIDLYMDLPTLTEHEAKFVKGTFKLAGQRGLEFIVSAQLEVKPLPIDNEYNASIITLLAVYGDDLELFLNELEELLNVQFPYSLGPIYYNSVNYNNVWNDSGYWLDSVAW